MLACLVLLGLWRGGGLIPSDRHRLVMATLLLAFLWALLELMPRKRDAPARDGWRSRPTTRAAAPFLALGALALWALVSAAWSLAPAASLWAAGALAGGLLYLGLGRYLWGVRIRGTSLAILVLCALGFAVSVASLYEYYAERATWFRVLEEVGHAQGPIGYANGLAALLLLTLAATVALVAHRRPWYALFSGLAIFVAVLQLWTLWLTRSRGAGLAFLAAAGVWVAVWAVRTLVAWARRGKSREGRRWEEALASGLLVALLALAGLLGVYGWERAIDPRQSPDQGRVQTWRAGVDTAVERPIQGWGADTWYQAYLPHRIGPPTRFAHSLPVQQTVELGIVGLLLLAAFVGSVFLPGLKLAWRSGPGDERLWLWVGTTAFLVQNLYDLNWYFPALFYVFCITVGASTAAAARDADPISSSSPPPLVKSRRRTPQKTRPRPAATRGRGRPRK